MVAKLSVRCSSNKWLLLLVFVSSSLLAQPAPPPTPKPIGADLTIENMILSVTQLDKESVSNMKLVVILQMKARRDKDVIRLNCINDKLIQIKSLRNILDNRRRDFEAAVARTEQQTKYEGVVETATSIRRLRDEARACAGEFQLISDMKSDWDGPDIPDDPSKDWFPPDIEPPGYASPFN